MFEMESEVLAPTTINKPLEAASFIYPAIPTAKQEVFMVMTMNSRNMPIFVSIVSLGTANSSLVHPRDVFRRAVEDNATGIIVAHTHPSQDLSPSRDDIDLTARLVKAGELLGILVLDHLILDPFDKTKFLSLREEGEMSNLKTTVEAELEAAEEE